MLILIRLVVYGVEYACVNLCSFRYHLVMLQRKTVSGDTVHHQNHVPLKAFDP